MKVTRKAVLSGHTGSVYALEPGTGSCVYTGGGDRVVAEWDLNHPADGNLLARTNDIIYSMLRIPGDRLLVGQAAGGVHVIGLESRKEERLLQFHQSGVFCMTLSARHNCIFTLSGDGELGMIDAVSLELKKKLVLGGGKLRAAALNKDETLLAIGAGDGIIRIFSLPEMQLLHQWQAHDAGFSVNAIRFSPDGSHLLSGSRDAHLKVHSVEKKYELVYDIPAHNYAIYSIEYDPEGKLFATASRDKTVKIWDASTFEVLIRINKENCDGHVNSVNKIIWHPSAGNLVSASDDRSVMVWQADR